ncbi:phenylalanine--tRNA ligase subunit beta [Candidatus Woesearchaeota archaeon]|nr:phenylalanine--tRNA ligase subunit beta [Candidatus Woesearchaeota archaeon]
MPVVNINKKVFDKLVGKKLSVEQLKDRISYLGTDLEEINDNEIIVEIFPNRPDMLSEQGFARAFSSFIGTKKGLRNYKVNKSNYKVIVDSSVKSIRPYTACAVVKNLKFDNEKIREIIQIQEKLHVTFGRDRKKAAIGIYPMEKIKWPIKYISKKPDEIKFQPLESNKVMTANQILNEHPAGKSYKHLLGGKEKYPLFIDSNNEVLSMPPIINSHKIGKIGENTKDVFIECSGFDLNILKQTLNIIVTALNEMNGDIYSVEINYGKKIITPDLKPTEMKLDLNYANKLLGLKLTHNEIKKYLEMMGYGYKNKVLIPAYRVDILHPIDLIEDIAIAYGYENFKEIIPNISTIGEENKFEIFKNKIADLLAGFGLMEVSNYNITSKNELSNINLNSDYIELISSNEEYNVLRNSIIQSLLKTLSNNKHNEYPQNIFEIGYTFKKGKSETGILEENKLAVALSHSKANFTGAKQIIDSLFENLGLNYTIENAENNIFIPGRVGKVIVNGKNIAYIGEINPYVLNKFGIETPVSAFELNLKELFDCLFTQKL